MQEVVEIIEKNTKEQIRIELTEFKGRDLLGVRVWAGTDNGLTATNKGIKVSVRLIPALLAALQKAEGAAVRAGRLGKGAETGSLTSTALIGQELAARRRATPRSPLRLMRASMTACDKGCLDGLPELWLDQSCHCAGLRLRIQL